jgi:hypothetical protein
VASAAVDASTDRRIAPFATGPVVAVATLVTVLHCATSTLGRGYWFDEVYVLAADTTWIGDRPISRRWRPRWPH